MSVGIVTGRNIGTNALRASLNKLKSLAERYGDKRWIAPSGLLLYSPVDLDSKDQLDCEIKSWLPLPHKSAISDYLDQDIN